MSNPRSSAGEGGQEYTGEGAEGRLVVKYMNTEFPWQGNSSCIQSQAEVWRKMRMLPSYLLILRGMLTTKPCSEKCCTNAGQNLAPESP